MGQLLAGANLQPAIGVADEVGVPLARPADHDDQAVVLVPLQIEVGHVGAGRTAAGGADALGRIAAEHRFQRGVIGIVGRRADVVVQQVLVLGRSLPANVQRLDVLDDRRVGRAGVLEVERPFDRGIIVVLDGLAAHR